MTGDQLLVLVSASKSRPKGDWSADDYDVRLGDAQGQVVGRVFKVAQPPQDRPWFWTITRRAPQRPTECGYAATREDSIAAFRSAWDPMPEGKRNS
jgi:hypothetical protein